MPWEAIYFFDILISIFYFGISTLGLDKYLTVYKQTAFMELQSAPIKCHIIVSTIKAA